MRRCDCQSRSRSGIWSWRRLLGLQDSIRVRDPETTDAPRRQRRGTPEQSADRGDRKLLTDFAHTASIHGTILHSGHWLSLRRGYVLAAESPVLK